MCCCGGDTKSITLAAGILALIQSFVGIVLSSVDINLFFEYQYKAPVIVQALKSSNISIRVLLVIFILLQIYWFLSSIGLIVANQKDQTCGIRQWLVATSFVIIAEVVFPIIAISVTVFDTDNGLMTQTVVNYSTAGSYYSRIVRSYFVSGFMNSYVTLVVTFGKAGLITLVLNIVMCVYAGRRVQTLSGSTGRVLPPVAAPVNVVVPTQIVAQPYYLPPPQYSQQPYYQSTTPMVFPGQQQQTVYAGQPQPGAYQAQQPLLYQGPQQMPQQHPQPPPYAASAQEQQPQQPNIPPVESKQG